MLVMAFWTASIVKRQGGEIVDDGWCGDDDCDCDDYVVIAAVLVQGVDELLI